MLRAPSRRLRLLAALGALDLAVGDSSVADTHFGKLLGDSSVWRVCDAWLGVPYAAPPLNELRFEAPQPWSKQYPLEGLKATAYGNTCLQPLGSGSEDCLFVNVWRKRGLSKDAALPVMVWIHGGSFEMGSGDVNGCALANEQNVIVASLNYRLGPLGYMAFEEGGSRYANFAMQDQRQAIRWLQQEVGAFGGDPAKITIFGESAGAISVMYHVASPLSHGLFRGAISESGFPSAACWETGRLNSHILAGLLGCNDTAAQRACLRRASASTIIKVAREKPLKPFGGMSLVWSPVVDGTDMPEYPIKLWAKGAVNRVPLLAGFNTNEANLFIYLSYWSAMNESGYRDYIKHYQENWEPVQKPIPEADNARLFATYPPVKDDNRPILAQAVTDATFLCATLYTGQKHSAMADTFVYRFNHRPAVSPPGIPGVRHACEIPFVFDESTTFDLAERFLGSRMRTAWANFAKELNPNAPDGISSVFPRYTNETRQALVWQTPADDIESDYRDSFCRLWYDISYSKLLNAPDTASAQIFV